MCGLAGIVTFDGSPPAPELVGRMGDSLRHRGPDAEGTFMDVRGVPALAFIHRRLAVIDLSRAADQPLGTENGSVQVMLNGEIYNYSDLRRTLEGRHSFDSNGDTEVVGHLFEEKGVDCFAALDGMFALAIWDSPGRRLVLARDPFGKKPLYYWHDSRRFLFASEIKALLAAGVPAEFEAAALSEYLGYGYVPTPRSLFRGVAKLPPASFMVVDANGVQEPHGYWDLRYPSRGEERPVGIREARERVRELLTEAVRKRLVADVPLGVLLSGGVDSSAVAAIMARLIPGRVKTFTVGFEGDRFFDERPHADSMARHIGSNHHAAVVKPDAVGLIETLLHHHDEPFGDSSALPTYLVAREARRHVTVALNGDGGDETFAGYDRFGAALLAAAIPSPVLRLACASIRFLPVGGNHHGISRRLRRFTEKATLPFEERFFAWSGFFDLPALHELDRDGLVHKERVLSSYREALARCNGASPLGRLLYLNIRTYLLDDLLPKMDRMTMAHGLEARSPLLDRGLMEYVASLPDAYKRRGTRGKIVLKQAVEDLLPPAIVRRRKHGFGVPLGDWFRGALRPLMNDTLMSSPRVGRWLRREAVEGLVAEHLSGRADHGHRLWTLLTLELWLRRYRFQ
jgi:asparagine synthase (glutamine-hydrolysing)